MRTFLFILAAGCRTETKAFIEEPNDPISLDADSDGFFRKRGL